MLVSLASQWSDLVDLQVFNWLCEFSHVERSVSFRFSCFLKMLFCRPNMSAEAEAEQNRLIAKFRKIVSRNRLALTDFTFAHCGLLYTFSFVKRSFVRSSALRHSKYLCDLFVY